MNDDTSMLKKLEVRIQILEENLEKEKEKGSTYFLHIISSMSSDLSIKEEYNLYLLKTLFEKLEIPLPDLDKM